MTIEADGISYEDDQIYDITTLDAITHFDAIVEKMSMHEKRESKGQSYNYRYSFNEEEILGVKSLMDDIMTDSMKDEFMAEMEIGEVDGVMYANKSAKVIPTGLNGVHVSIGFNDEIHVLTVKDIFDGFYRIVLIDENGSWKMDRIERFDEQMRAYIRDYNYDTGSISVEDIVEMLSKTTTIDGLMDTYFMYWFDGAMAEQFASTLGGIYQAMPFEDFVVEITMYDQSTQHTISDYLLYNIRYEDEEGYQQIEEKIEGLAEHKVYEYFVECLIEAISRYREGVD